MVALETPVCQFGATPPAFTLKDVQGGLFSLDDCRGDNGLLVMFICNHCPFVKAIVDDLVADCKTLQDAGIGIVAIMSNDYAAYPDDSPENMAAFAAAHGFTFPYLIDEDQAVAKSYGAVCTPDFFGYNKDLGLQYRGRFDQAGRNRTDSSNHELREAMLSVAKTGQGPQDQTPSIGCSIKWRQQAA